MVIFEEVEAVYKSTFDTLLSRQDRWMTLGKSLS